MKKIVSLTLSLVCLFVLNSKGQVSTKIFDISSGLKSIGFQYELAPNDTTLDAGPALEFAVKYAISKGFNKLTIPRGEYYFKSVRNNSHLFISSISNFTFDGNNSLFNFYNRSARGVAFFNCNNVRLQNLKVDYSHDLPSASRVIDNVDIDNYRVNLKTALNSESLLKFNQKTLKSNLWAFIFRRDPTEVNCFSKRLPVQKGNVDDNGIQFSQNEVDELKKILPGDIILISDRSTGGANAVNFQTYPPNINMGNAADNVTIYSSPAIGMAGLWQRGLKFSNIYVIPKPGRVQYMCSNADGINLSNDVSDYTVTNCHTSNTGDDGISFSSGFYGTVSELLGSNQLNAEMNIYFNKGQTLLFTNPETFQEVGEATIISINKLQTTSPTSKIPIFSINFDQLPSGVAPNSQISLPDTLRGYNTLVKDNFVENSFARGIYFGGICNVQILNNTVNQTISCGIYGCRAYEYGAGGFKSPSVSDVTISGNKLTDIFKWSRTNEKGAITVNGVTGPTEVKINKNVHILNNSVTFFHNPESNYQPIFVSHTVNQEITNNKQFIKEPSGKINKY